MIYQQKPENFSPKFETVSCFVEHQEKILLLLRQDHKSEGNKWGVPAGKTDQGEQVSKAIAREIREETGFSISDSQTSYFGKVYVRYPNYDFVYHIFHLKLDKVLKAQINHTEHKDFKWITPQNALQTPLVRDLDNCIKLFYKI